MPGSPRAIAKQKMGGKLAGDPKGCGKCGLPKCECGYKDRGASGSGGSSGSSGQTKEK